MAGILHLRRRARRLSAGPHGADSRPADQPGESAGRSAASRPYTAPFPGIHSRDELLEDLEYAVKPESTPSVLVLFGFKNLREHLDSMLEADGEKLLGSIAERLADAAGKRAILYEPRRGDFCALFSEDLATTRRRLEHAVADIDDETKALEITTMLGFVELPAEAETTAAALDLADARRSEAGGDLRLTRRGTVYSRVSSALGRSRDLHETA